MTTVDIERVVALEPDLILATSIHEKTVIPALEKVGLTVLALAPETLDGVLANITLVGEITGQSQEADQLVTSLAARIKVVTDKTATAASPRVLYLVWHDPLMAPGAGTFQDSLISKAGGTNIARDLTGWATISLEVVIEANPEVMIAGVGHGTGENLNFQFLKTEPRLRDTDARRHDRVYAIDGNLVSRPGPRIVDGLEQLARLIHPEIFEE